MLVDDLIKELEQHKGKCLICFDCNGSPHNIFTVEEIGDGSLDDSTVYVYGGPPFDEVKDVH